MTAVVNVNETIDRHPITGYQVGVLALCMLAAAFDGYDTQAIGYTAPVIAGALHLPREVFGPVFSAALIGAALGALSFGPLADRFGRKRFLLAAVVIFGVFSLATAQVTTLPALLAVRFCTGLGLGGALPSFLALGGEFAPVSKRSVFVAVAFASWPFGGMIGALTSSYVIPHFGWQSVFYIGGIGPLVFAAVLVVYLPESLRFLIARNVRLDEVRRILDRIAPGEVPADASLVAAPEIERQGVPVKHLFTEGRAAHTLMLWVAFFAVFMVLVTVTAWTPTVLHAAGFSVSAGALIIALNNGGSVCASAFSGFIVDRFGPYRTLVQASFSAVCASPRLDRRPPLWRPWRLLRRSPASSLAAREPACWLWQLDFIRPQYGRPGSAGAWAWDGSVKSAGRSAPALWSDGAPAPAPCFTQPQCLA